MYSWGKITFLIRTSNQGQFIKLLYYEYPGILNKAKNVHLGEEVLAKPKEAGPAVCPHSGCSVSSFRRCCRLKYKTPLKPWYEF